MLRRRSHRSLWLILLPAGLVALQVLSALWFFVSPRIGPPPSRMIDILYATDRAQDKEDVLQNFTGGRSPKMSFGVVGVRVPERHVEGRVERPWHFSLWTIDIGRREFPGNDFLINRIVSLPEDKFVDALRDTHRDTAVIFVHGYNNSFNDSAYRFAQIIWDAQLFDVAPIMYSWPSINQMFYYEYDRNSAVLSANSFLDVLRLVQIDGGIKKIHIIAHSMGNLLLTEAIAKSSLIFGPFSELVFAAPDVERDVFVKRLPKIREVARGLTLYASAADRPLGLMGLLGKIPRAGDVTSDGPTVIEKGIDTIDVTEVGQDLFALNHSTFASNPVIEDLARLISRGEHPPSVRTSRIFGMPLNASEPRYWRYVK